MTLIAHLSDLHFGCIDQKVLTPLAQSLSERAPDVIIISGDLTQHGTNRQFKEARDYLACLTAPLFVVPGNHDIPAFNLVARFAGTYDRYTRYIHPTTSPDYHDDNLAIVGMNSARPWGWHWNWAHGRLLGSEIANVATRFERLGSHPHRIVVFHHPIVPPPDRPGHRLVGRLSPALQQFAACRVKLILAGHAHRTYTDVLKIGNHAIRAVHTGTTTSTRLRGEPNRYSLLRLADATLERTIVEWDGVTFAERGRAYHPI